MTHAKSKFIWGLWGLVSLSLMLSSLFGLRHPMDWDELDSAARIASPESYVDDPTNPYGNVDVINPLKNTRNHALASLATKVSFALFGVSEVTARLPAVLFTVLLCALLFFLVKNVFTTPVATVVLLHVAANGTLLWYSHSMRGYIPMVFFSLMALTALIAFLSGTRTRLIQGIFIASQLALVLCHAFGILFFLFFNVTLVLYTVLGGKPVWEKTKRLMASSLLILPVPLTILVAQFLFLNRIGMLKDRHGQNLGPAFLSSLGLGADLGSALGLVAVLALVFGTLKRFPQTRTQFLTLFNVIWMAGIFCFVALLRPEYFDGRFLLPFTLPFVWGVTQTSISLNVRRPLVVGLLALVFGLAPVCYWDATYQKQASQMGNFHVFAKKAARRVALYEAPCLSVSGDDDQSRFVRDIYLYKEFRREPTTCRTYFHFHFARNWRGELPLEIPPGFTSRKLLQDSDGRQFYELIPEAPQPVTYS